MVAIVKTHTGKMYVDAERKLEFLTVGSRFGSYCVRS